MATLKNYLFSRKYPPHCPHCAEYTVWLLNHLRPDLPEIDCRGTVKMYHVSDSRIGAVPRLFLGQVVAAGTAAFYQISDREERPIQRHALVLVVRELSLIVDAHQARKFPEARVSISGHSRRLNSALADNTAERPGQYNYPNHIEVSGQNTPRRVLSQSRYVPERSGPSAASQGPTHED